MLWNVCLPGAVGDTACDQRGANALIITPLPPRADARVSVGDLSALFLIQLPLSATSLRRGGMVYNFIG